MSAAASSITAAPELLAVVDHSATCGMMAELSHEAPRRNLVTGNEGVHGEYIADVTIRRTRKIGKGSLVEDTPCIMRITDPDTKGAIRLMAFGASADKVETSSIRDFR